MECQAILCLALLTMSGSFFLLLYVEFQRFELCIRDTDADTTTMTTTYDNNKSCKQRWVGLSPPGLACRDVHHPPTNPRHSPTLPNARLLT